MDANECWSDAGMLHAYEGMDQEQAEEILRDVSFAVQRRSPC